jgi:hypothetical protein
MKMRRFWWFPGRLEPTSFAIGTRSTLAMVWLINVEITCSRRLENAMDGKADSVDVPERPEIE